jgi:hypothetical protein
MDTQSEAMTPSNVTRRVLWRILMILIAAVAIGSVLNLLTRSSDNNAGPAGFGKGVLHGVLMPAALPNLLFGKDVSIYAPNNTGRTYKLGYTVGVNGCGLIFFGFFFWRLSRLRKLASEQRGKS